MDTGKAVVKLAIPAIVGFMVMAVYNAADTLFVSWWNYKGAGAVQVIFPIMMIASAIGLTFGIGGGSYISRLLGREKQERANSVVTTSLFTALVIAVFYIAIVLYFMEDIVAMFGASGDMIKLSADYGFYIVMGAMFVIPSMVLNNSLRAEGSAKFSMMGMGLGSLINIFLDPIFIFTLDLGLNGAALATMLSQAISFAILLQFYLRKKTILKISPKYFIFDVDIYKHIFKIGTPTFFRQILFSISMGLLNRAADFWGGEDLLSASGIAIKVTAIIGFFIFGMGQGVQPVVGYNYGAKNMKRVISAQRHGILKTFTLTTIFSIITMIFARYIMMFFTTENLVIEYGIIAIRAMVLANMMMSISNTITIIFQAIGYAREAMLFSVLRSGFALIPAILILPRIFGAYGVLFTTFTADLITMLVALAVYLPFVKKEKAKLGKYNY